MTFYTLHQRVRYGETVAEVRGRTFEECPSYDLLVGNVIVKSVPGGEIRPLENKEDRCEDLSVL